MSTDLIDIDFEFEVYRKANTDCFGIFVSPIKKAEPEFDNKGGVILSKKYGTVAYTGSKIGMPQIKKVRENYLYNEYRDCFYHASFVNA